ncbi:MAG TPA: ribosome biogenesis GTPase Der [Planctomycetes bacterium]|jgi:GTP-binding protein|nr:ribosome biogenesis GTPase Der [Planctomycetota bacterium]
MSLPVIAIVGRPNVGKSSLLNSFAGERISIVDSTPGVTRDRVSALVPFRDVVMEMVDTGGIGVVDQDDLSDHIERQIAFALEGANLILFVVDVRDGITPLDRMVAARLRQRSEEIPLILAANKVDHPNLESGVHEFHRLGLGDPHGVSANEGWGRKDLLQEISGKVWPTAGVETDPVMRIAVVGRRNVGKSTFVNVMAQEERVIVSEVPGTTRDAVDVRFQKDGREFVVIDTAGIQRRKGIKDSIEFYSQVRTLGAIQRADVVLFLLDASEEITRADKKLGETISKAHKVCVMVANKWDLSGGKIATEAYAKYLSDRMPGMIYAPIVFTTAKESRNTQAAIDLAQNLYKRASLRAGTGELNRVMKAILKHRPPPAKKGKSGKIYYATQVAASPPIFVVFVNQPKAFSNDYRRYIANSLREALKFEEIPIRIIFRQRESQYHD